MEFAQLTGGRPAAVPSPHPISGRTQVRRPELARRARCRMFSIRCMLWLATKDRKKMWDMPKDQRVDQVRLKFRKGSADAMGQFGKETVAFFDDRHVPSNSLPSVAPRFITGLTKCRVLTKPKVVQSMLR